MLSDLKGESRKSAMDNKGYIVCFRNSAFALIADGNTFDTRLFSDFELPGESEMNTEPVESKSLYELDTLTDKERFYVEQFHNGSLNEDYDNGKPKVRAETENGLKDGKYREYYEDGSLKIKGSYKKGKKDGRWKYYDENGKLIKKENYKNGELDE